MAEDIPIKILYEDDYLLVIDKPKTWWSTPRWAIRQGRSSTPSSTTSAMRTKGDERPGIVHRLDKGTTGVIIVAKDRTTQETLSRHFPRPGTWKRSTGRSSRGS